ncbi:hypothetical protein WJX73_003921 [Symbiochloris irregularis]|uniref:Secreted protein n=1 Tax=Symbiochloris irregularis TaxID=706552 RepID=A0AAW1NPS4_9CHLO
MVLWFKARWSMHIRKAPLGFFTKMTGPFSPSDMAAELLGPMFCVSSSCSWTLRTLARNTGYDSVERLGRSCLSFARICWNYIRAALRYLSR